MVNYEHLKEKDQLFSLWAHEVSRVFGDRLINDTDREWFYEQLADPLQKTFEFEWDANYIRNEILFGDYLSSTKEYQRIESQD